MENITDNQIPCSFAQPKSNL